MAVRFAQTVSDATRGRIKIEVFPAGALVRPFETFDAVGAGVADMYHTYEAYFENKAPVEHNVTSQSGPARFASKNFAQGQSFRVTLSRPGVLHYLCTIHPASMNGTIEVVR